MRAHNLRRDSPAMTALKNRLNADIDAKSAVIPIAIGIIQAILLTLILLNEARLDYLIYYLDYKLYNVCIYMPFLFLLVLLPINWYCVYILNAVFAFGVFYLNEFLLSARGRPLHFVDFFCVNDALRVAKNYSPVFNTHILKMLIFTVVSTILTCVIYRKCCREPLKIKKKSIVGGIFLVGNILLILASHSLRLWDTSYVSFDEKAYVALRGLPFALYSEYVNSMPSPPEGYSEGLSGEILSRYPQSDTAAAEGAPDKIYVIMNESLADYSLIGDLKPGVPDPLEALHNISDNCVKGRCAVSIYGGNTANSEFEFLTGCSMCFLPAGSVPYVTYSFEGRASLAAELSSLGYSATAVHPFFGQEWKRATVYPQIGFSQFISAEKFSALYEQERGVDLMNLDPNGEISFGSDLEYLRAFISDRECYRKISELSGDGRDFIFTVTMQNHGGYPDTHLPGAISYCDNPFSNIYLNLSHASGEAFAEFLETLRQTEERTVVLMFGDHQPVLNADAHILEGKYSDNTSAMQAVADNYIVPYILWANYDIEWDAPEFVSLNYLSAVLKENCGLPLTPFDSFRLEVMAEYPVITANFAVDKNGEYISPEEAKQSQYGREYAAVQYDYLK